MIPDIILAKLETEIKDLPPYLEEAEIIRQYVLFQKHLPHDDLLVIAHGILDSIQEYQKIHQEKGWLGKIWSWITGETKKMDATCKKLSLFATKLSTLHALSQAKENGLIFDRHVTIEILAKATQFPEKLFSTLSDEELNEFAPVIQELVLSEKASGEIQFSLEDHNFAKFSRAFFPGLRRSLSLAIMENEEGEPVLQLVKTYHRAKEEEWDKEMHKNLRESGAFKEGQLLPKEGLYKAKAKDYVQLPTDEPNDVPQKDEENKNKMIQREKSLVAALRKSKLFKKYKPFLSLSTIVRYKNKKGKIKVVFLSRYMNQGNLWDPSKIPGGQAISVFEQIAKGIEGIHKSGHAHLDLHPGNILLHVDNEGVATAKVADFDFCVGIKEGWEKTGVNRTRGEDDPFSPMYYKSPLEKSDLTFEGDQFQPCDIYALGKMLTAFYRGNPPIPETQRIALLDLSVRMTSNDPQKRPSIEKVVKELGRIKTL